jgi:catechol 2,3-dioxygenase-like lactoylglutathione lyase family enzyme
MATHFLFRTLINHPAWLWALAVLSVAAPATLKALNPSNAAEDTGAPRTDALAAGPAVAADAGEARFYVVDVGHGNAVFVLAPSGEVMLIDTGSVRTADRVLAFMAQNNIRKIDCLVASHFEDDHMGAAARIAEKVPVLCFVDHGESVVYGKDDAWWRQHRGPWFREGMGKLYDESFDVYRAARGKARHIVVKAGDRVPITGLDVVVVSSAGKVITQPLEGAGAPSPACAGVDRRAEDDAEDGQSVGVVVRFGKFRFADFGDLTWNTANALFCPKNLIGTVDAYLITHHAQSLPRDLGDYYYGLSSCSPAEVNGLHPRVAILSLGALGHRGGTPDAIKAVQGVPGLDLWQTEFIRDGGEKGCNGPEQFIANLGEKSDKVPYIELAANADGSFAAMNSRNGCTRKYPAQLPIARLAQVTWRVGDLQKARQFYGGVMGFEEAFQEKDAQGQGRGLWFKVNDDQFVAFLPGAGGEGECRLDRVSLLTPDIRRAHQMLRARGLACGDVQAEADGNPHFWFADPDGTRLDLVQYMPGSRQSEARGKTNGVTRISDHMQHVGLAVANRDASMTFYCNSLGFWETTRGGPAPDDIRWINLMMPGTHGDYIELMVHAADPLAGRQHICFAVPDIQQAHKLLLERGLPANFKPFHSKEGLWLMNLRDPNGLRVEFMEIKQIAQ